MAAWIIRNANPSQADHQKPFLVHRNTQPKRRLLSQPDSIYFGSLGMCPRRHCDRRIVCPSQPPPKAPLTNVLTAGEPKSTPKLAYLAADSCFSCYSGQLPHEAPKKLPLWKDPMARSETTPSIYLVCYVIPAEEHFVTLVPSKRDISVFRDFSPSSIWMEQNARLPVTQIQLLGCGRERTSFFSLRQTSELCVSNQGQIMLVADTVNPQRGRILDRFVQVLSLVWTR